MFFPEPNAPGLSRVATKDTFEHRIQIVAHPDKTQIGKVRTVHRRLVVLLLCVIQHARHYVGLWLQLVLDGGDEAACQHHSSAYFGQLYSSLACDSASISSLSEKRLDTFDMIALAISA